MTRFSRHWLFAAGLLCLAGALVHLAIPLGGPDWYAFFGAPPALATMAAAGLARPAVTCVLIATVLLGMSAYAFSALGSLRPLPGVRAVLSLVGLGLTLRGAAFPIGAMQAPWRLGQVCGRCDSFNGFVLLTSALCLFIGMGFLLGASGFRRASSP
jgi:hypothetical protein